MTKEVKDTSGLQQNKVDQKNLFAEASVEMLLELVQAFGIPANKIPEQPTKENLMALLVAANRHDVAIARTVKLPDGSEKECPPGHMIIRVTPKAAGMEWGQKSREVFFFAVQGECVVGRRGVNVVIPDKYRSAWRDAVGYEYTLSGDPQVHPDTGELIPPKMQKVERFAEDVTEVYWNRDLEKEKKDEEDLIAGSIEYQKHKAAERALRQAVMNVGR